MGAGAAPRRIGRLVAGALLAVPGTAMVAGSGLAAWAIWRPVPMPPPGGASGHVPLGHHGRSSFLMVGDHAFATGTWQAKAIVAAPGVLGLMPIAGGATLLLARGRADAHA